MCVAEKLQNFHIISIFFKYFTSANSLLFSIEPSPYFFLLEFMQKSQPTRQFAVTSILWTLEQNTQPRNFLTIYEVCRKRDVASIRIFEMLNSSLCCFCSHKSNANEGFIHTRVWMFSSFATQPIGDFISLRICFSRLNWAQNKNSAKHFMAHQKSLLFWLTFAYIAEWFLYIVVNNALPFAETK